MKYRVLITDPISDSGVEIFKNNNFEIIDRINNKDNLDDVIDIIDAWIIRSGTKISECHIKAAKKLQVIGRAGVGVDNIDIKTATKYGEEQVQLWRRSYDVAPPRLSDDDKRHPRFNEQFKDIENIPTGESLKNVIDRLYPFWNQYVENIKEHPGNHLIVAHSNSLRAIVKILDQLSDEEIVSVNNPTGVLLVYQFDDNFNVIHKEYLIDQAKLQEKQAIVVNQGKAK